MLEIQTKSLLYCVILLLILSFLSQVKSRVIDDDGLTTIAITTETAETTAEATYTTAAEITAETTNTTAAEITAETEDTTMKTTEDGSNDFKMGDEGQLIKFEAGEQAKIAKVIKKMQPDETLNAFKNLSIIMNKAIGILPKKVIPILLRLSASYSTTRTAIEVGFTSATGILSKFVIKSWQVMQHGMNKKDQKALMAVGNQLNTNFIDKLDTFVELSRVELVEIQSQLLLKATGGKIQYLLDKRKELETDFLQLSTLLRNKSSECGMNQDIIDLLQTTSLLTKIGSTFSKSPRITHTYPSVKNSSSRFTVDHASIRNAMDLGATKLKEQMHGCKNKLEKQRDSWFEKGRSSSRLSQNHQNVHESNMTLNAREKFKQFMERADSPDVTNETLKCNTNQGITDFHEQTRKISGKIKSQLDVAKDEMVLVVAKLKEQMNDYKNKIQEYRDRRSEQRGMAWILSWKVREVYTSNGANIVQENVNRLRNRTNFLQNLSQNGSILYLVKGLLDGKQSLPFYEGKKIELEEEYKEIKQRHDQISQEFHIVVDEIDEIYRSTGTLNVKRLKMVDELCRAVQSGQESITSAYAIMRIHLSTISIDSDLLVASVLDALQVLNMIDGYFDTTKIEDLKQELALD